jgi:hypothetical protein
MARYKHIDTSPRFLAVDLQRQLIPGTIEHALNHLLNHEIDLTHFSEAPQRCDWSDSLSARQAAQGGAARPSNPG